MHSGGHVFTRKVWKEAGLQMEMGGPGKKGPEGDSTWMLSSWWMCLQRQEEEMQSPPTPLSWSKFMASLLPWEQRQHLCHRDLPEGS